MTISQRQGSSTAPPQPTETPQETSQAPESSSSAETRTTPTRTVSASQTSPNTSSEEQTSSRQQSTTDDATTTSARETTTSSSNINSSTSPISTSDQPTSTRDPQTSSGQSQTSEASISQTPTESATTPTPSATDSATSRGFSSSAAPLSTVLSVSDTPTPIPTLTPSPSLPTSQSPLPTFTTETAGSSNTPRSTAISRSTLNPTITTAPLPSSSPSSEAGTSSSLTSIVITVVSDINGVPTTFTTVVPTLATSPNRSSGLSARTTSIVGGVIGGTLALLGILLALFYISRRRRKVAATRNNPRLQAPRQILDTDDFDLAEPPGPAPYAYGVVGARVNPNASGSIFHEDLPGTAAHHSHTHSRSVVSENDPLLVQHMHGGYPDAESIATTSPRESAHFRASSTTGLLYDPSDPFGDGRSDGSTSLRGNPIALAKAREARSRVPDPHAYPPSSYHGPHPDQVFPMHPVGSGVLVHRDAGRVDASNIGEIPPSYASTGRPNRKDYPSDPIKARFAIRIEISDKQAFPQQRPSPQANAAQKLGRIQRALATWQPAASLVRSSNEEITRPQVGSSNAPTKIFDLPAGSVAPPQAREETSSQQERASSALQPKPGLAYSPPLRMRPRASRRQVVANPLQTDSDATSAESRTIANSVDSESVTAFHIDLPARSVQLPSSKRERILEQARRAAATEAKLIADQKAATEAASASAEQTHEIDKPQVRRNIPLSIWSRFLGR
ncbi:hypothetical protein FRC07_009696 [Ceratobasidium sp. 392]|nr:hypothetical protein FRC07_009696 [Ceratobasidium sp. 392]